MPSQSTNTNSQSLSHIYILKEKFSRKLIPKIHSNALVIFCFCTTGVIEFLQRYPVDLNVRHGTNQLSILHLAVNVQDKKILHYLIKNTSVHINATDSKASP